MATTKQTSKAYFKSLKTIHLGLLAVQLIYGVVMISLVLQEKELTDELKSNYEIIIPGGMLIAIIASIYFSAKKVFEIKSIPDIKERFAAYRKILILKYILLVIPSIVAITGTYVTANYVFLGLGFLTLLIFFVNQPSIEKAVIELKLNQEDKATIENPETVIAEI